MFVQRALRTGLVLVLMGGLASGPLAVFSTARSQITQETAIGPDAADALAQMGIAVLDIPFLRRTERRIASHR
jgi:hypothetical protein